MLDLGWTELLVIGVVALIVVGPKDLPGMFRSLGQFTSKMRRMAREFSRAMEDAAEQSGAKDIARDLKKIETVTKPGKTAASAFKEATGLSDKDFDPFDPDADTDSNSIAKPGPATQALSEERAEAAQKIREHSAARAEARMQAEADAAAKAEPPAPASPPATETDKA